MSNNNDDKDINYFKIGIEHYHEWKRRERYAIDKRHWTGLAQLWCAEGAEMKRIMVRRVTSLTILELYECGVLHDADKLLRCLQTYDLCDPSDWHLLHSDLDVLEVMMKTQSLVVVQWMIAHGWTCKFRKECMQWVVRHGRMDLLLEVCPHMDMDHYFQYWLICLEENFPEAMQLLLTQTQVYENMVAFASADIIAYTLPHRAPRFIDFVCVCLNVGHPLLGDIKLANHVMCQLCQKGEFEEVALVIVRHTGPFLSNVQRAAALKTFVVKNWLQAAEALLNTTRATICTTLTKEPEIPRGEECSAAIGWATCAKCVELLFRFGAKATTNDPQFDPKERLHSSVTFAEPDTLTVMCDRVASKVAGDDALCALVTEIKATDALNTWKRNMRLLLWNKTPVIASALKEVVAPMVGTLPDNVASFLRAKWRDDDCKASLRQAVTTCHAAKQQNRPFLGARSMWGKRKLSS